MGSENAAGEVDLQSLAYGARVLEGYLSELVSRETLLSRLISDHRAAAEAVESLPEEGEADCMMPIGGGVSVPAKVSGGSKYLVAVGAGVLMRKSKGEALDYLNRKLRELEEALRATAEQRRKVEEQLAALEARMREMLQGQA